MANTVWEEDMEIRVARCEALADLAFTSVDKPEVAEINIAKVTMESQGYSALKAECSKALIEAENCHFAQAHRLINGIYMKNLACLSLIHYINGTVCFRAATVNIDPKEKQLQLNNSVKSARTAVKLSPNSLVLALFYAKVLYKMADYEGLVRECERALMIKKPIDPRMESLEDEILENVEAEARIKQIKNEIRALLEKVKGIKNASKTSCEKKGKKVIRLNTKL